MGWGGVAVGSRAEAECVTGRRPPRKAAAVSLAAVALQCSLNCTKRKLADV